MPPNRCRRTIFRKKPRRRTKCSRRLISHEIRVPTSRAKTIRSSRGKGNTPLFSPRKAMSQWAKPVVVMLSEAKHLVFLAVYEDEILRLRFIYDTVSTG